MFCAVNMSEIDTVCCVLPPTRRFKVPAPSVPVSSVKSTSRSSLSGSSASWHWPGVRQRKLLSCGPPPQAASRSAAARNLTPSSYLAAELDQRFPLPARHRAQVCDRHAVGDVLRDADERLGLRQRRVRRDHGTAVVG